MNFTPHVTCRPQVQESTRGAIRSVHGGFGALQLRAGHMLADQDFRGLPGRSCCCSHMLCLIVAFFGCAVARCILVRHEDWPRRTIKWYKEDGQTPAVQRHPLNQRKTGSAVRGYVKRIFESGIIQSVRGEPWMTFDELTGTYYALSCGTLLLGTTTHDNMHAVQQVITGP